MDQSTIVITGANRGIGLQLARTYLQAGNWTIIACCRDPENATDLKRLLKGSNNNLVLHRLDVTDPKSVDEFVQTVKNVEIDLLLNNAGIMGGDRQSSMDMDYDQWMETFRVNTMAPLRMVQALVPNLKLSRSPKIVTISSQMGSLSREGLGSIAYRSSKAAVNKVMQVVALDLKKEGITVALIHPGWVETDMGGRNAEITPMQSARGIFDVVSSLTLADTGRFLKWTGEDHPW